MLVTVCLIGASDSVNLNQEDPVTNTVQSLSLYE